MLLLVRSGTFINHPLEGVICPEIFWIERFLGIYIRYPRGGGGTEHYWSDTEEKQAKERKDTINNLEASDKTIPRELESFSREDVLARGNEQSPQQ